MAMKKLTLTIEVRMSYPPIKAGEEGKPMKIPIEDARTFKDNRSQILDESIRLEWELEEILEKLLTSNLYDSQEFGKNFWHWRDVTFNVKWEMLRALTKCYKGLEKEKSLWEDYITLLKKIIEYRNMFAHGKVFWELDKVYLFYKEKPKHLDDIFWDNIEDIFKKITDLSAKLRFNYRIS